MEWVTSWTTMVFALMLFAVTIGFLRFLFSALFIGRLARASTPLVDSRLHQVAERLADQLDISETVQLQQSATLPTAATFGWRRPVVLLPATWGQWPDEQLQAVLAHELAHVAQRDFFFGLVGQLVVAMHFYHPLVHWLARRLRLEQELAADAVAARLAGGQEVYLQSLAALTLRADRLPTGWAIQTFLPTRSLFVRRIEMLKRMGKIKPGKRTGRARAVVIGALVAVGLAAVGLRGPARVNTARAEPQAPADTPVVAAESARAGYDFAYVPETFTFLLAIRPAEMASSLQWAPYVDLLDSIMRPSIGVEALEQVTLVLPLPKRTEEGHIIPGTGSEYTVFRTNRPLKFKQPLEAAYGSITLEQHNAHQFMAWDANLGTNVFYAPNERTLLSTPRPQLFAVMDNLDASQPPAQSASWCDETTGPLFGILDLQAARSLFGLQKTNKLLGGFPLQMISPLLLLHKVQRTILPAVRSARARAIENRSQINLKRIALALLNYESAHGHYPPPVLYDQETGTPYSWRVAILPYLEQKALHDQYHFGEPWDSEHNRRIADTVVPAFCASSDLNSTHSAYYVLVGPETIFSGKDGVKLREVKDGTSNTLMVVEAKRAIPWTKPEDITYAQDEPLPQLGGYSTGGFVASFADGSVRFFSDEIEPETLRNLIEKADGNLVDRKSLR